MVNFSQVINDPMNGSSEEEVQWNIEGLIAIRV